MTMTAWTTRAVVTSPSARRWPYGRTAAAALLAGLCLLAACQTAPSAQLVRFHNGQPARGTIAVIPVAGTEAGLAFRAVASPVAQELQRVGYVVVEDPAEAQFLARVGHAADQRLGPPKDPAFSIGIGGGTRIGNVGIGTSMRVPIGPTPQPEVLKVESLSVAINERASGEPVWEGRAALDRAQPAGSPDLSAALARTLFREFPGQSGKSTKAPLG